MYAFLWCCIFSVLCCHKNQYNKEIYSQSKYIYSLQKQKYEPLFLIKSLTHYKNIHEYFIETSEQDLLYYSECLQSKGRGRESIDVSKLGSGPVNLNYGSGSGAYPNIFAAFGNFCKIIDTVPSLD
jgi:hypothetical protein